MIKSAEEIAASETVLSPLPFSVIAVRQRVCSASHACHHVHSARLSRQLHQLHAAQVSLLFKVM